MADKTVKVHIGLVVADYLAGAKKVADANRQMAGEADKTEKRIAMQREAMQTIGPVAAGMGLALLGVTGIALTMASAFEKSMSGVAADLDVGGRALGALREAALDAGASTQYSATEAANAIRELGKAGVSTADILAGGLSGSLNLAAAGELEVARAAEITATTLQQFRLSGTQATHVSDLLAAGAGKAQGSVDDMAMAMKYAGIPMADLGVSVEEAAGSVALLANNGILGEQAGTSLRAMLMSMTAPTKEATAVMNRYGISTFDASGKFVGMANMAEQLRSKLGHLTDAERNAALGRIFGNESISAAQAVMRAGSAGVVEWTSKVNDQGFAARVAAEKTNNLAGDVERLGGSFETAMIRLGAGGQGPARAAVQTLTTIVDAVGAMDPVMQGILLTSTAVAGGLLLLGGTALTVIPQLAATTTAMETLGISSGGAAGALGAVRGAMVALVTNPIALAIAAAIGVLGAGFAESTRYAGEYSAALREAKTAQDLFYARAKATSDTFGGQHVELQQAAADWSRLGEVISKYGQTASGESFTLLDDSELLRTETRISEIGEGLAKLTTTNLPAVAKGFADFAKETDGSSTQLIALLDLMGPKFKEATAAQARALGNNIGDLDTYSGKLQLANYLIDQSASAGEEFTNSLSNIGAAGKDTTGTIGELADALRKFNELVYGTYDAEMAFYSAQEQLVEQVGKGTVAIDEQTGKIDLSTKAGRDAMDALMGLGQATLDYAAYTYEMTGSQEQTQAVLEAGRAKFIEQMTLLTGNADAAAALADELIGIPSEVTSKISVETQAAQDSVDSFITTNNGREIGIIINARSGNQEIGGLGHSNKGLAYGGPIDGSGPKGIDSVPIWAAPGEHMWTAREVDALGGHAAMIRLRAAVLNGSLRGYAAGGPIQSAVMSAPPSYAMPSITTQAPVINVQVIAQPGMSEEQVGRIAAREVASALR